MNFIKNIDTICILVDIESYEEKSKRILKYLEKEKNNAKVYTNDNSNYKHIIKVGNMSFQIFTNGTKGYSYILHNEGYQINIAQFKSKIDTFYPIQIRISSEFLWSKGMVVAWEEIIKWIEKNFGKVIDNKVYRLDLCLHTSDIDFITDYEKVYKGKFKKRSVNYNGLTINCLYFGTRKGKNIYCRIYNKTLEIQETRSKTWFYEIWQKNKLDIENVWNLEFELKSEFLREMQINSMEDVCYSLKSLWEYCTKSWLLKIDNTRTRIERCPINSQWSEIQDAYNEFNSISFITREKQISMEAESLIPSIVGNITSYCARTNSDNIEDALKKMNKDINKYLRNKETDMNTEVKRKSKVLEDNITKKVKKEGVKKNG